jgi:hypothetical protein
MTELKCLLAVVRRNLKMTLQIREENIMSGGIDPEAALPATTQAFNQSDRNPAVVNWGGTETEGGQIMTPALSESRVTVMPAGPATTAGMENYNVEDGSFKNEE